MDLMVGMVTHPNPSQMSSLTIKKKKNFTKGVSKVLKEQID